MLRFHFTAADVMRTHVSTRPDPLWDLILAANLLGNRDGRVVFDAWRAEARKRLAGLPPWQPRLLRTLAPPVGDFPDFLTPAAASASAAKLEAGIDMVLSTPKAGLRADLACLPASSPGLRRLADGEPAALTALGTALRACHAALVGPHTDRVRALVDADLARRARDVLGGGVAGLLAGLAPTLRWRDPVLEADYPDNREVHLGGRGLLLIPSVFCWRKPVTFIDPGLPPVVVYPVDRGPQWSSPPAAGSVDPLVSLLGRRRASCLRHLADTCSTTELARRIGAGPASASQHAAVLREAGLVISARHGNTMLHTLTPLGHALLSGTTGLEAVP
ncbi:winged helix-turn-helix domain-containing protein [Streptomyces sp. NPDC051940]|uniref:ArsR/SmtB family transcription factor n=1 Tax=Streptomyces sp. NPDC051940 TaxID=3155675 RepID=UPI00343E87E4